MTAAHASERSMQPSRISTHSAERAVGTRSGGEAAATHIVPVRTPSHAAQLTSHRTCRAASARRPSPLAESEPQPGDAARRRRHRRRSGGRRCARREGRALSVRQQRAARCHHVRGACRTRRGRVMDVSRASAVRAAAAAALTSPTGSISATSRLHLSCISATSRGCTGGGVDESDRSDAEHAHRRGRVVLARGLARERMRWGLGRGVLPRGEGPEARARLSLNPLRRGERQVRMGPSRLTTAHLGSSAPSRLHLRSSRLISLLRGDEVGRRADEGDGASEHSRKGEGHHQLLGRDGGREGSGPRARDGHEHRADGRVVQHRREQHRGEHLHTGRRRTSARLLPPARSGGAARISTIIPY